MKVRNLSLGIAASFLMATSLGAASKVQFCPTDLVSAKATTAALTAAGAPHRTPSSGYERITYQPTNLFHLGRPVNKIVVERSASLTKKGTGHYLLSFFALGTITDLISPLKAQVPAAKCEPGFCSGSAAVLPGAEGSLEYGSVQELDAGRTVVLRCKYRDNAYGKLMLAGGLAGTP